MLEELAAGRQFEFAAERAVFLTALHRLFVSGSDRAAEKWRADYRSATGTQGCASLRARRDNPPTASRSASHRAHRGPGDRGFESGSLQRGVRCIAGFGCPAMAAPVLFLLRPTLSAMGPILPTELILAAGLILATLSVAWVHCVVEVTNDVVEALRGSGMRNRNCGH